MVLERLGRPLRRLLPDAPVSTALPQTPYSAVPALLGDACTPDDLRRRLPPSVTLYPLQGGGTPGVTDLGGGASLGWILGVDAAGVEYGINAVVLFAPDVAPVVFRDPTGTRAVRRDELAPWPDWAMGDVPEGLAERVWRALDPGPYGVNFQIGDVCNAKCVMCWQSLRREVQERDRWSKEMRAEVVEAILYKHPGVGVELVSFGEPMANPDFSRMVDAARRYGARRVSAITNGSLLDRHLDLLALPGDLTISIDAASPRLYAEIRVGLSWSRLIANLALCAGERHPDRKVGVNLTVFARNADQVVPVAALCDAFGFDYLSVLHGAGLDTTAAKGEEIAKDDPRLVAGITTARERFPRLRINDYATARDLPPVADVAAPVLPHRGFCPLPWRQYDVGPDGRAHPCCRSYYTDLGPADGEVWNGEPLVELRRQILAGDVDPVRFADCAKCPNLGIDGRRR